MKKTGLQHQAADALAVRLSQPPLVKMPPQAHIQIGVIVPVRNEETKLPATLSARANQFYLAALRE